MYMRQVGRASLFACLASSILVILASVSSAQTDSWRRVRYPTFSSSFSFKNWSKEEAGAKSSIMEIATPVTVIYPVTRSFTLTMATATVFSSLDAETESKLNGITDTQIRSFYTMADDTVLIGAGLNLPIGKNSLSKDELEVSRTLSDNVLGFERNRLGGGLDIDLSGGIAEDFGPLVIGGGIGYLIKGEYEYLGESEYKPGNELSLTAGADMAIGKLMLRSDVTYAMYSPNKLNGVKAFKEGTKLSAEGVLFFSVGPVTLLASAREIIRGKIVEYPGLAGSLLEAEKKDLGNQLNLDGVVYWRAATGLILKAITEARLMGENESGTGEAFGAGFGCGLTVIPLRGMLIDVTGEYLTGQADGNVDLAGFGANVGLKWEF
jgi:hypothetical protein